MSRRRWTVLIAIVAVLVILPVACVVALVVYDWNRAKPWLEARASASLGREIEVGGNVDLVWRWRRRIDGTDTFSPGFALVAEDRRDILDYISATGIVPDVIIIDYLGEAASSRLPMHLMSNTNVYYTSVAREFRSLGFEFNCPVWTGMQFNREKQMATDGDISDLADAIGIPKVADFIMAFYAPDELAAVKKARASILKNRYANKQKLKSFLFGMDQDKQILFDLDWNEVKRDLTDEEAKYVENVHIKHDLNKTGDSNDSKKAETVNSWTF